MIVNPHVGNGMDGTLIRMVEQIHPKIPIVPISRINDFKFNADLHRLTSYVLIDMTELDWDTPYEKTGTHLFGKNTANFHHFNTDEWKKFDEFVDNNKPVLYFKRELLKKDVTEDVIPIDYFNWVKHISVQPKDVYLKRDLDCFFYWGRSHEGRLRLHGDIWQGATRHGYSVSDNLMFMNEFMANEQGRKWCSFWMPHYRRIDISYILSINGMAKTSLAPFGAGRKTFRHLESSVNSLMVTWEDNFAWAYPWVSGENCIKAEEGKEVDTIIEALKDEDKLYEMYVNCTHNANKYRVDKYCKDYIEKKINEVA